MPKKSGKNNNLEKVAPMLTIEAVMLWTSSWMKVLSIVPLMIHTSTFLRDGLALRDSFLVR